MGSTALFDPMAATWDRYYTSDGRMLNRIGRFCEALEARAQPGEQILDFGCGTGQISRELASHGWHITGADVSGGMLQQAKALAVENCRWVQLDNAPGSPLPFDDGSFSAAVASSVLEYVADPKATLQELARVVRAGGWLVITVPDLRHRKRKVDRWKRPLTCITPVRKMLLQTRLRNAVSRTYASRNHWRLDRWQDAIGAAGLVPQPIAPCVDPLAMLIAQKATA